MRQPPSIAPAALPTGSAPATPASGPATSAQEGLWLLHHSYEERYLYNCPFAFRLNGPLECEALSNAFDDLVQRHSSLRTVFAFEPGRLTQVVRSDSSFAMRTVDLSSLSTTQAQDELARLGRVESMAEFDLANGPLLRALLVVLGREDHALVVTLHHVVFDEWSVDVLIHEVGALYDLCVTGREASELAPLPVQFIDFAGDRRTAQSSPGFERQLAYWRSTLAAASPPVTLPPDHQPQAGQADFRGAREHFSLAPQTCRALQALAQQEFSPPVAIIIAALATTLGRYTRERDVSLGYLVSGRVQAATEGLIGLFVNSLVMRVQLGDNPSFLELTRKTRDLAFEAYSNQDVPFQRVVRELNPTRDAFGHPLFRACVNYHPAIRRSLTLSGIDARPLAICQDIAQFELLLDASPAADGSLECFIEYRTALYDAGTVRRFVWHFCRLLDAYLTSPATPVDKPSMIDEAERDRLVHGWNATARNYDLRTGVAERLATLARDLPDKPALVFAERSLTYAEFDRLSDSVASFLRQRGIGPEDVVGLCAEASIELIVAMFGILKAGAAYVALEPQDPPARLALMLRDAHVAFVLTQTTLIDRFADGPPSACMDRDAPLFSATVESAPHAVRDARQLAYLMYTSGSTGQPKAVAVSWANVCNHVQSFREASGLRASDRCMLFSSCAFDGSVEEIFAPLLTGATLVIHPERPIPIETLEALIVEHGLTFLDFTAGYWNVWLELLQARGGQVPEPVRQVVIGGEMIRASQLRSWDRVDRGGQVGLLITYGPTEATVIATAIPYTGAAAAEPIAHRDGYLGRPLGNIAVYVLDEDLRPVPMGAVGEVYIAGANVARGYFGAPALTAQRFIPDPYASVPGDRMYRTGDLALRLTDGTIQYHGRADDQVKFRGFRIELGEIETALTQYPNVQAAVARVVSAPNGDRALVAFVMPAGGEEPGIPALAQFLAAKLPSFMVPQRIEVLRSFPVKLSGKTDLTRLVEGIDWTRDPDRAEAAAPASADVTTPSAALAGEVAALFMTLLARGPIGPDDNFFKAGGHSLLALQVLSRIRQSRGVNMPMKEFYLHPTAVGIAAAIERLQHDRTLEDQRKTSPISRIQRAAVQGAAQ